jgi:hypothetical protein
MRKNMDRISRKSNEDRGDKTKAKASWLPFCYLRIKKVQRLDETMPCIDYDKASERSRSRCHSVTPHTFSICNV